MTFSFCSLSLSLSLQQNNLPAPITKLPRWNSCLTQMQTTTSRTGNPTTCLHISPQGVWPGSSQTPAWFPAHGPWLPAVQPGISPPWTAPETPAGFAGLASKSTTCKHYGFSYNLTSFRSSKSVIKGVGWLVLIRYLSVESWHSTLLWFTETKHMKNSGFHRPWFQKYPNVAETRCVLK